MFKVLVKKQFMELFRNSYINKKTGKAKSRGQIKASFFIFAFLMVLLAGVFFFMSAMIGSTLIPMGMAWLYFSIVGVMAFLLGVFGSVFNTYAGIYKSNDNEILLSLPIKPSVILGSRLLSVYALSFLYTSLVLIPGTIYYWIAGDCGILQIVCPVILWFAMAFAVSAVTAFLGWVVAFFARRIRNTAIISTILGGGFFVIYFIVCQNFQYYIEAIAENAGQIGDTIKKAFYPAYAFGEGACGGIIEFLVFLVISAVLAYLAYLLMARTFIKMAISNKGAKTKEYKEKTVKAKSVGKALLWKEAKRFTSSTTYMLNCGLLLVIAVIGAVAIIWKGPDIAQVLYLIPDIEEYLPVGIIMLVFLAASTCVISAPSISLEGKNIWILQSLPIKAYDVLSAKTKFHFILSAVASLLLSLACVFAFDIVDGACAVSVCLATVVYSYVIADIGLILNLKMPNLTWTNETVPVKQGAPVVITLFGGWLVAMLVFGAFLGLRLGLGVDIGASKYCDVILIILVLVHMLCDKWLKGTGSRIFASL
ncbi:MAG: hypothetical protein MJ145_02025 [Clostridia bacterium]|nr:hypothetical protein [Clostridia bacterium]